VSFAMLVYFWPTGQVADGAGALPFAVGSGAAIAALGAALIATDPEKR
jgi:hypothetical protein